MTRADTWTVEEPREWQLAFGPRMMVWPISSDDISRSPTGEHPMVAVAFTEIDAERIADDHNRSAE